MNPDQLIAVGVVGGIAAIGFAQLLRRLHRVDERLHFATGFEARLRTLITSGATDDAIYESLTLDSNRMQRELGRAGLITYKPAAQNLLMHDHPVILNLLPDYKREMRDPFLSGTRTPHESADLLLDTLLRHRGALGESIALYRQRLRNPLEWMAEGLRGIVSVPLAFLRLFGIVSEPTIAKAQSSAAFKVLTALVALVTFIASVVTILAGWQQVVDLVSPIWP